MQALQGRISVKSGDPPLFLSRRSFQAGTIFEVTAEIIRQKCYNAEIENG